VDLEEIKTLIQQIKPGSNEDLKSLIETFIEKNGDNPELQEKLRALLPKDNTTVLEEIKTLIQQIKLDCPPVDLEEIKTLIRSIKPQNLDEIRDLIRQMNINELSDGMKGIKAKLDTMTKDDIISLLEEIKTKEPELLNSLEQKQTAGFEQIQSLIREIQPQSLDEVKTLIETTNERLSEMDQKMEILTNMLAGLATDEIKPTFDNTQTLLARLGEARGNISRLLTKPGKSLNIKATQITEKAAEAAQEATMALEALNRIKADNSKSVEEVEASVEEATQSRNKADRLISEARQLWELISPSEPDPNSAAAPGEERPNGLIQAGGKHEKANINSAKEKINALSDSVSDAKRIIQEKRTRTYLSSEAKIRELNAQIAAAMAELEILRKRVGEGGKHIVEARELELKVQSLTGFLKQIIGDTPNLEQGVRNHIEADSETVKEGDVLKAQLLTLTQQHNSQLVIIRDQLQAALLERDSLKGDASSITAQYQELQNAAKRMLQEQKAATSALQKQIADCSKKLVSSEQIIYERDGTIDELNKQNGVLEAEIERILQQSTKKTPLPKAIPGYAGNTAAARGHREAAQALHNRMRTGRTAALPRYGGKKGARFTRAQKKIIPL